MPKRRHFLGGAAALLGGAYIHHRGLRYPRMGFEAPALNHHLLSDGDSISAADAIFNPAKSTSIPLRAIGLEPKLNIELDSGRTRTFELKNVSQMAQLKISGDAKLQIDESRENLTRRVTVSGRGNATLEWFLAEPDGANFAVIGDTGAGDELEWVLQRAKALGADFLLHLGDFNYVDGEYQRAIELFDNPTLPCFISIGNHDYNDSGLVYQLFLDHLGPLNHAFEFAGTRFLSIDTAADFFPAYSGLRGRLLDHIEHSGLRAFDCVCFTHRNFLDPRPGEDHTIGGVGEKPWLADKLQSCGASHILTGHVHRSAEMEYRGLKQFTVGEGLGFEDIVHEKRVAQLLMGTVSRGQTVKYRWVDLELPWRFHTSPEHEEKLLREHPASKLEWYMNKMNSVGAKL